MERLTFEVDTKTKRQFMAQIALRGRTIKSVLGDAVRYWFRLVDAARDAVEGDMRPLQQILEELDSE